MSIKYIIQERIRMPELPQLLTEWTCTSMTAGTKGNLIRIFEGLIENLKLKYKVDRVGYYLSCNEGSLQYRVVNKYGQEVRQL